MRYDSFEFAVDIFDFLSFFPSLFFEGQHVLADRHCEDTDHGLVEAAEDVIVDCAAKLGAVERVGWQWNSNTQSGIDRCQL